MLNTGRSRDGILTPPSVRNSDVVCNERISVPREDCSIADRSPQKNPVCLWCSVHFWSRGRQTQYCGQTVPGRRNHRRRLQHSTGQIFRRSRSLDRFQRPDFQAKPKPSTCGPTWSPPTIWTKPGPFSATFYALEANVRPANTFFFFLTPTYGGTAGYVHIVKPQPVMRLQGRKARNAFVARHGYQW